jgi:histidine triad (HIT) family protein
MEKDCIFCKIAGKKKKEEIVFENEEFLVFKDANPSAPVHLLIIPKEHLGAASCDIEGRSSVCGKIFPLARQIAQKMGVEDSYKLVMNAGYSASETPDHLHVHLVGGWESPTEVKHV